MEAPGASVAFAAKAPLADVDDDKAEPANTTEAMRAVLSEWMASYSEDEMAFASKAVFIEMRLRQALACSASIGVPNQFRCAIVCDAWERVVPFTGRLESMLKLLWSELLRCLFVDYAPNMVGAGAKAYAARTPFFVEAQRLRRVQEAAAVKMRAWEIQREQELMVVAERNKAINHTLGAWNRALGFSAGTKQDPAIAEQLSVLAGSLREANSEAGELSRQASTEPRQRCRQAFEQLTPEEQASFVLETALAAPSAADWLAGRSHDESARTLAPMLSKMPKEEQESLFDALAEALGLSPLRRSLPTESATAGAQAAAGIDANAGRDAAAAVSATHSLGSSDGAGGGASAAAKGGSALSRIQRSSIGKVLSQQQSLSPAQDTVLAHRTAALASSVGNAPGPVPASVLLSAVPREGAAAGAAGERLPVAIPIAIPGSGLERWRQREEELITALKAGQEREARAEARLGGLQAQLRDSAATGARRVAQLQQEHAAAHAKLQKQLGELRDQLGAAQVESSRAQLLCEVAQATEQSASRAVRRLDARLDAEWERRNALEKLVSEYERRAEQAEREALTERDRKLAAESSAAVAAERAAATVADLKQRLAAALQLVTGSSAQQAADESAAATAAAALAAAEADRRLQIERHVLEDRLMAVEAALAAARMDLVDRTEREHTLVASETQLARVEIERLELELARTREDAEASVETRIRLALEVQGRREAELCDQKLAAATALAATAAKQAQAEAEATKATALAEMQAEMQAETERRLAAQREAVQAQAQTALLHAQLRADQPLGPSTGLALPTATRA